MSEADWRDAEWAADAVQRMLRRVLFKLADRFAQAAVTLRFPPEER
jgi:hypothetical protein